MMIPFTAAKSIWREKILYYLEDVIIAKDIVLITGFV